MRSSSEESVRAHADQIRRGRVFLHESPQISGTWSLSEEAWIAEDVPTVLTSLARLSSCAAPHTSLSVRAWRETTPTTAESCPAQVPHFFSWASEGGRAGLVTGFFNSFESEARGSRRNNQPSPVLVQLTNERQAPNKLRHFLPNGSPPNKGKTTPSGRSQLTFERWYTTLTPAIRRCFPRPSCAHRLHKG